MTSAPCQIVPAQRFRLRERPAASAAPAPSPEPAALVLVIDGSPALALLLAERVRASLDVRVVVAHSIAEARAAIAAERPVLALSGLALRDGTRGEVLDALEELGVPAIVFTATIDRRLRLRLTQPPVVDYFLKDGPGALDAIVAAAGHFLENSRCGVLIVDDMRSARAYLGEIVRRCNFAVFEADSGQAALEILAKRPMIDVVLADFHMPGMDGQQLTTCIRELHAEGDLRIIGISGSTDPYLSASLLKAGANDFIYRPFVEEEVKVRIENNVENLRMIRHLRHLAEHDPLTGLLNRRAFFSHGRRLLKSGGGHVAVIDIDHFKAINDTHGHDAGDAVLGAVARAIGASVGGPARRGKALAARLGGEEFAVILAGSSAAGVARQCEALRKAIGSLATVHAGTPIAVTISIGVAEAADPAALDNALNQADKALYRSKIDGRNRTTRAA